jgi:translocator protein
MRKTGNIQWKALIISIAIPLAAGAVSGLISGSNMANYQQLNQPALSPPGFLFPIVWTILYILMGISAYLIYISDSPRKKPALTVYGLQLVVNLLWSPIFFGLQQYWFAFVWLVLLWLLIIWMIWLFRKIDKTAAWLQLPYLVWVTFAGYLNLAVAMMN